MTPSGIHFAQTHDFSICYETLRSHLPAESPLKMQDCRLVLARID
jgi:hypothetical protein